MFTLRRHEDEGPMSANAIEAELGQRLEAEPLALCFLRQAARRSLLAAAA